MDTTRFLQLTVSLIPIVVLLSAILFLLKTWILMFQQPKPDLNDDGWPMDETADPFEQEKEQLD